MGNRFLELIGENSISLNLNNLWKQKSDYGKKIYKLLLSIKYINARYRIPTLKMQL